MPSFSSFDLLPSLLATLAEQNLTRPTEIQVRTLPLLLQGASLVGIAETGSGKTLAYVLPLLHRLKSAEDAGSRVTEGGRPRGLVLVPSRELGEQVARVFKAFTHDTRLRVRTALGGSARAVARRNTSDPFEILVATPGRALQLLETEAVSFEDVRTLVLDEADQMLDPGFLPTAARIVDACPPQRQVALVSATLPGAVEALLPALFGSPPTVVQTRGSRRVVPTLTTDNRKIVDGRRFELLLSVLAEPTDGSTLVFVNNREQADKLARELDEAGIAHAVYRGEMDKQARKASLASFRDGAVRLLIATDLGSRGLDVEGVTRVVNYHMPHQHEAYLHRVGRTARAGRSGLVVNLYTGKDAKIIARLDKLQAR